MALFKLNSYSISATLGGVPTKIATGTSTKCIMQLQPNFAARIVEYGISFDGSSATEPIQVQLQEVDVAATMTTAYFFPASTVATAISSGSTTTLVLGAAIAPSGTTADFALRTYAAPGTAGGGEEMLVTSGQATTSLTVTRGVFGTAALSSIPVGTTAFGMFGTGAIGDLEPKGYYDPHDPTWALFANAGTAASGFNGSTMNSPKYLRVYDTQNLIPTSNYVLQQPPEREWWITPGKFTQIVVNNPGTGVNCTAYMDILV